MAHHGLNVEPSLVWQTALSPDEVEPPQVLPRSHESGLQREMLFQQVFSTPRGRSPISVTVAHLVMEELNKGNSPPQVLRMVAILMEIVCRQHLHSPTQNQQFHNHLNSIEQFSLPLTQSWKGRCGVECRMSLAWNHKRNGWALSLGSCEACPKCVCLSN